MQTENTIEYKGYFINPETEPWALKGGAKFNYSRNDGDLLRTGVTIEDCKEQIDELTCNENLN